MPEKSGIEASELERNKKHSLQKSSPKTRKEKITDQLFPSGSNDEK